MAVPFFLILFGLITFGVILALKQSVTNAAAEGARSAVGIADDATATARAEATARDRLTWLRDDQEAAVVVTAVVNPCVAGAGRCIEVVVTYPYDSEPLVPELPIISAATPSTFSSTAVVQITE